MFRRQVLTLAAAAAALTLPGLPAAQAQTKWDLAAAYPATNFHSVNLVSFADEVRRLTNGRLDITVHAAASLFKAPEIKRAVQGGQAQAGEILLVNFQNEWQIYGADGIPFMADSYDEAAKLYRLQRPMLERKLGEQGMMLLYSVPWPPQGLFSKRPINTLADLRGIKWRAYSPSTARIGELIGAQSVTVQAAELSQAMATGVVESFITSGATGVDSKVFEHLKFYYDVQAWLPKNAVIVNRRAFDALDAATQQAVLTAARNAETRGTEASRRVTTESMATLRANGMTVSPPSPALAAELKRIGEQLQREWIERAGAEGRELVNAYLKP